MDNTVNQLLDISAGTHRLRGVMDALYPNDGYTNIFEFAADKLVSLEKENKELKGRIKELEERKVYPCSC
jgi:hypothetical protein